MSRTAIEATISELATMFSEDGASLRTLLIDHARALVELEVALDDLECADCVLPPDRLRATIAAALQRQTGVAIDVILHDPRADRPLDRATETRAAAAYVVLDPAGVAPDDGALDAGPDATDLAGSTVAFRHDVLWPAFDWTLEEWTTLLERAGATVLAWPRAQGLKDEAFAAADAEWEAIVARSDIAISGLANCGSCTSWSVRDAITARARGLAATVVATAHFEPLARLLSAEGGRPGMRITVLPYPYSTLDEATVRAHARAEFPQLLAVLGVEAGAAAGSR